MNVLFYTAAIVAIFSTAMVVTRFNAVHALLYLIVSLLSVSLIFFVLGAPFVAALEVIVYAGAIMVLFVFVIMMLNLGPPAIAQEQQWLSSKTWRLPLLLTLILLVETGFVLKGDPAWLPGSRIVEPREVGLALFGPYLLVVELASMLLLGGLIAAFYLGRRSPGSGKGANP